MRKTPRGWIQIGESRTRGVARIPLGLKPSRDSRATSQRDSPIWIQPLGVFRYRMVYSGIRGRWIVGFVRLVYYFSHKTMDVTVKLVCNDRLYNTIYYLWFIEQCVLMKTEGTNSLLLTISRRQRSIPLGGRYRQVSQVLLIHAFILTKLCGCQCKGLSKLYRIYVYCELMIHKLGPDKVVHLGILHTILWIWFSRKEKKTFHGSLSLKFNLKIRQYWDM